MRFMMRAALLSLGLLSASANAQSHEGSSFQLSTGGGSAIRGDYRTRVGWAVDGMFSAPVTTSIRWGVSASVQGGFPTGDDCVRKTPNGECLTSQPLLVNGSLLAGRVWKLRGPNSAWSFRMYGGPSIVRAYDRTPNPDRWIAMGGATGRLELMWHAATHLDVVGVLRSAYIPALPKDARGTHGFTVGVAVH